MSEKISAERINGDFDSKPSTVESVLQDSVFQPRGKTFKIPSEPVFQPINKTFKISSQPSPSFNCFRDPAGNHFTRVSIPNGKSLNLIHWKDTPKPRLMCDQVSRKFQEFYDAGNLNYIKGGRSNKTGKSIICGMAKNIECDEKNKLFDLSQPYVQPASSLADDLKKIFRDSDFDSQSRPIYQGSDNELVINFQEILAQLRNQKK